MRTIKILLPGCLILACAAAAAAQGTPDGAPPSEETVCDGFIGAAHGLCTAYCEAMDCDSDAPQASQNACDKVGAKFTQITGQDPPCENTSGCNSACPCCQNPDFNAGMNSTAVSCVEVATPDFSFDQVNLGVSVGPLLYAAAGAPGGPPNVCGLIRSAFDLEITEPQARACIDLLKQKAAADDIECVLEPR